MTTIRVERDGADFCLFGISKSTTTNHQIDYDLHWAYGKESPQTICNNGFAIHRKICLDGGDKNAIMQQQLRLGIMLNRLSSTFEANRLLFPRPHRTGLLLLSNNHYPSTTARIPPHCQSYFLSLNFDFNFPKNPLDRFDFLSAAELLAAGFGFAAGTALSGCCDVWGAALEPTPVVTDG